MQRRRSSSSITLVLVGASALSAYGQSPQTADTMRRDVYGSKTDCVQDWGEDFGPHLPASAIAVIEPPWKVPMSSKAILPVLWELNPNHPNLLPCYFDQSKLQSQQFVRKPVYSREGANVDLHTSRGILSQPGTYGAEGFAYQAYSPLPDFNGDYPVIDIAIHIPSVCFN